MKKVVAFGELLMRLTPPDDCKIGQSKQFNVNYGGSEANVVAALATYGVETSFVSTLPDNSVGRDALKTLHYHGIDTKYLDLVNYGRMGIYFLEPGVNECSRVCTYDRKHSSIATTPDWYFDWNAIFADALLFHFSGITPALSDKVKKNCQIALEKAKQKGVTISCDINYRSKLWSKEQASEVMKDLCKYADILFINEEEASLLGFEARGENLMDVEKFKEMVEFLHKEYPAKYITTAARVPLDSVNLGIQGIIWSEDGIYRSEIYPLKHVIDPTGAGDAYAAAVLYGLLRQMPLQEVANLGAAAGCLKHYCCGDINLATMDEIKEFASKQTSSGMKR